MDTAANLHNIQATKTEGGVAPPKRTLSTPPRPYPPRHHDPAALRVFVFQASWPPNNFSRSWTGSHLYCKCSGLRQGGSAGQVARSLRTLRRDVGP
ncbi:hypothetical protein CABS01_06416 [Colletotrichum abscissum]|uniref:Uncharacterized protein n=2 Tax=Colletotrichum acutatum species complex TaxID=2707335 RepID=A0A9Q0AW75_9PEZI|nr:uncharacterized protein CTAM01_10354 [Colletotrichum tamarilloi]XP_060404319.1 uncharacterized protein CABS01_06416 [Colletotrichum abscissum]KAI3547787.1 hypothetical protein CSPX01_03364 [Colletotrichum filicis]KAI3538881.1 hypothetical protein CABS02_11647 [Colletotrichum abscissum]KAK1491239.1 hypothetical protein CTAM01_10354 [Colletotrichum tamarilloi]KAK1516449.1 hypothetical protein CABS01_06416 [Colletotrichum abscissum]